MSLLDNLPHKATIRRRTRAAGALGGSKDSSIVEQTDVLCWEQRASARERDTYQKKGMLLTSKIFFASDPNVTERHQILITERNGTTVVSPIPLDVGVFSNPDASAGKEALYRVMAFIETGEDD